jgi:hypothetical protein
MNASDEISLALAILTAAMAIATGLMALFTYQLAESTVKGNRQADQHHQQDLRPFCIVEFSGASFPHDVFGGDFDPAARRIKANMGVMGTASLGNEIYIRGELKNKGQGLAKEIVVYLNTRRGAGENGAFRLTRPVVVAGLVGAGETIEFDVTITARDVMQIWNGTAWKDIFGIEFIPNEVYEVVLEYKDIFENYFRTVHPKGVWQDAVADSASINQKHKQIEMVLRPNVPMSVFLSGQQTVQTMADFAHLPQTPGQLNQDGVG